MAAAVFTAGSTTVHSPALTDPRIAQAARGDRRAQQALMAELLPRVRNLVRYLVRGDYEVDDITQECLIAVLRGLPTYRGEGAFRSWVDRVVARATFAHLRHSRQASATRDLGADLHLLPQGEDAPDEYAQRRQAVELLDQLSYDQRHALVLHHVLEMSVPEIAEHLGVPFETVRSRLRLGKAHLCSLQAAQGVKP